MMVTCISLGIPTLRALEVTAARIDDAAVPDRECEHSRLGALRAPARVMEDDQPEIVLWTRASSSNLSDSGWPRPSWNSEKTGRQARFRQPLDAPRRARRAASPVNASLM